MTVNIRTAAQAEAVANVNFPLYHPSQRMPVDLTPFARSQFIDGAVWGAARVTPTREQLAEALELALTEFRDKREIPRLEDHLADAILALMTELAEGSE